MRYKGSKKRKPQALAAAPKMRMPIKKPIKNASIMGDGLIFPASSSNASSDNCESSSGFIGTKCHSLFDLCEI